MKTHMATLISHVAKSESGLFNSDYVTKSEGSAVKTQVTLKSEPAAVKCDAMN